MIGDALAQLLYLIIFALLFAAATAIFIAWSAKRRENRNTAVLFVTIIAALVLSIALQHGVGSLTQLFISASFAAIAFMLSIFYKNRPLFFIAFVVLLIYGASLAYNSINTSIGMFGVGTIIGLFFRERFITKKRDDKSKRRTRTEVRRDAFQIMIGIVIIAIMLFTRNYTYIIFGLLILGYALNNYIAAYGGGLYRTLAELEREGVEYGRGATHLIAGICILLGFASSPLALFGIATLIFGDAIATIAGIRFYKSRRLPHNKRKSYAGTFAFLIVGLIFGIPILGVYGIPIALALAVVESLDLPIDDNIAIPIATLLLGLLVR